MSKRIDFSFNGGFPLDETTLDKMQQASVEFFKSIIAYIGVPEVGNYILSGVTVTSTSISSGWVYMDGDIIPFPAMTGTTGLTTKLLKQTLGESVSFEDGGNHPVYITTSVVVDASGVELSTFERVNGIPVLPPNIVIDPANLTTTPPELTVLQRIGLLEAMLKPIKNGDTPIFFNKPANQIPQGYAEWLPGRGVTLVGVDPTILNGNFVNPEFAPLTTGQIDPGRTGGSKDAVLVSHSHGVSNIGESRYGSNSGNPGSELHGSEGDSSDYHQVPTITTSTVGVSGVGKNLQPYRTVLFIYWVGI